MKNLFIMGALLASIGVNAQIELIKTDAELILNQVVWQGLGARSQHTLSKGQAECMTLTNYDNVVDFDCIITQANHEVDVSKRDLQGIVTYTSRPISPKWGFSTRFDRAKVFCKHSKVCELTKSMSFEDERHRYCYMTSHTRYTGRRLEETSAQQTIQVGSSRCSTRVGSDFLGNTHTTVQMEISIADGLGSTHGVNKLFSGDSFEGNVSTAEACEEFYSLFGGVNSHFNVLVDRKLSESEWTSIRNTNKAEHEDVTVTFANGRVFRGSANQASETGSYCAGFVRK